MQRRKRLSMIELGAVVATLGLMASVAMLMVTV